MIEFILNNPYIRLFIDLLAVATAICPILYKFGPSWYRSIIKRIAHIVQRMYYAKLDTVAFITWRDAQLRKIYGDNYFTEVEGKSYPAFSIPFADFYNYNEFSKDGKVYSKDEIQTKGYEIKDGEVFFPHFLKTSVMTTGLEAELKHKRKLYRKYRRIVRLGIKYPKLVGFSLDHYDFNKEGAVTHFYPKLGTYEYNVYSSHILEYELFEAYKQVNGRINISLDELWGYLPFRRYIHYGTGQKDSGKDVLLTGARRYSLFSVQCIVVYKDNAYGDYRTLLMRRSTNPSEVAAKLGYYQFLPAGGFELYEKELIHSVETIRDHYSLRKAIFREYLEEVYNIKEFKAFQADGNTEATDSILHHEKVQKVIKLMNEGKATLNLLGIVVDLVSLRHEISFVLRVDDPSFANEEFCANAEFQHDYAKGGKGRVPFTKVEQLLKGDGYTPEKAPKFNQASALLYKMFKESPFFSQCIEK